MNFIIDAQLPYGIKKILTDKGHDTIHTDDLHEKERTGDATIRTIAEKEMRIVITKDSDFFDSYYIQGIPKKLFLITTGNIKNKKLFDLFSANLSRIIRLFEKNNFVEMDNEQIIGHE